MKFDRSSPVHWLYAAWLVTLSIGASMVARVLGPVQPGRVVLSGHMFNGNLAQIARSRAETDGDDEWCYLSMSRATIPSGCPLRVLRMWRPGDCLDLARASVVVTDHGPGILGVLARLVPRIQLADVWHGVGFKALGDGYAPKMRRYGLVIAASSWDRRDQVDRAGMDPAIVQDLGYALIEPLLEANDAEDSTRQLLVAPTWSHGVGAASPGLMDPEVLMGLSHWAVERRWTVVVRAHLNTDATAPGMERITARPMADAPDTVRELLSSSILVTDWSSIATDFHVSGRPVVYWDRPPPFSDFRLEPTDRVGPVVQTVDELVDALDRVADPSWYLATYGERRMALVAKAHGSGLDGAASRRAVQGIRGLMDR